AAQHDCLRPIAIDVSAWTMPSSSAWRVEDAPPSRARVDGCFVAIRRSGIASHEMPEISRFLGVVIGMFFNAGLHKQELLANWERARQRQPLARIEPLE